VVRTGDVVPDALRRPRAQEDRPGVADRAEQFERLGHHHLEVLRRHRVRHVDGSRDVSDDDDAPVVGERASDDLGARRVGEQQLERLLDLVRQRGIVGDQVGGGAWIVLGLRHEVDRHECGLGRRVREDEHLARTGEHVDADVTHHELLRRSHVCVAGADDLVHARDRARTVCQRGHGLRAADLVDL
jgi:hypothetical protein